jgi:hypothetical protein
VKFVFRDNALYLAIFDGGVLIPVPGGGASGCFRLETPGLLEELKLLPGPSKPGPAPPGKH